MINRNNLKQKYKSEFDRQKNYDVILNKAEKKTRTISSCGNNGNTHPYHPVCSKTIQ